MRHMCYWSPKGAHAEVLEQVGHLHGVSLSELGELVLPNEELLRDVVPTEQIRPEDDLPEVRQRVEGSVWLETLVKEPPHLEPVVLSLRHARRSNPQP